MNNRTDITEDFFNFLEKNKEKVEFEYARVSNHTFKVDDKEYVVMSKLFCTSIEDDVISEIVKSLNDENINFQSPCVFYIYNVSTDYESANNKNKKISFVRYKKVKS